MEIFSALLAFCAGNSPVPGEFPAQRSVTRTFVFSLIFAWINAWVNNGEAGDLRRHHVHYDVMVMVFHVKWQHCSQNCQKIFSLLWKATSGQVNNDLRRHCTHVTPLWTSFSTASMLRYAYRATANKDHVFVYPQKWNECNNPDAENCNFDIRLYNETGAVRRTN